MIDPHRLVETHAGKDAHVRVKRVDQSEVTMIRTWARMSRGEAWMSKWWEVAAWYAPGALRETQPTSSRAGEGVA
jgi:hypothetical protein